MLRTGQGAAPVQGMDSRAARLFITMELIMNICMDIVEYINEVKNNC